MIAPMTRVEVVCLRSIRPALVRSLHNRGLLHIEEAPLELEDAPDFLGRARLEAPENEELTRLEELERTLNEITPLLATKPYSEAVRQATKNQSKWPDSEWKTHVGGWAAQLRELTRRKATIQDELDVLHNYHTILEQVAPALSGNDATLSRGTRAVVLTGANANAAIDRIQEKFTEAFGPGVKFHLNRQRKKVVGLITFPENREEEAGRLLASEGVTPIDMRDTADEGQTVKQVIERIDATIEQRRTELLEVNTRLAGYSEEVAAEVHAMRVILSDRLSQLRVNEQFAESQMLTVIRGWTPSDYYRDLEKALEREFAGQAEVTQIPFDLHHEKPPTQLRNNKWIQPFEVVMSIFRPPTYGTIDPTILVAISFVIFYGFILGDAAYGVIIVLLATWLRNRYGHIHPAIKAATTIGVYMGVSSIIFGVIYGEYFGNFVERFWEAYLPGHMPYLFHRAHETTQLLALAVLFGVVHIPLALILGIREDFRHDHKKHAFEKLGMLLTLLGGMVAVFGYFEVFPFYTTPATYVAAALAIVGVILIFVAMGAMGLIGVIEVMSLGGNVLSYARLMALGVASIALADIANDMPEMMGWFFGILAAILIHTANIFIGIASPTIHSLRLNFVEFLPKFYSPQGISYKPFRKETSW